MATAVLETLLTAEEFRRLPDDERPQSGSRSRARTDHSRNTAGIPCYRKAVFGMSRGRLDD